MLEASEDAVLKTNDALMSLPKDSFSKATYIPDMISRLSKQYDKADNGTLVALLTMNYLQLKQGDSIYHSRGQHPRLLVWRHHRMHGAVEQRPQHWLLSPGRSRLGRHGHILLHIHPA